VGIGIARADRVVNANEPVVISDDISNRLRVVQSGADVPLPIEESAGEDPTDDGTPAGGGDPSGGANAGGGKTQEFAPEH
jgi:hypothetical protein